jgi:surface antigen
MRRTPNAAPSALVAALALLLLGASREALAVSSCGDQSNSCSCGKSNPYPCCSNGGNCTWWAWEAACCNWKVGLPGWGNANQWAGNAKANASYEVKTSAVVGSIGVRVSGTYGHVVYVTAVSGSTITVTEMSCGGFYGMRSHSYASSYFDGGFIVKKSACACTPGKTSTASCGNCGTKTRTCGTDCQWGSYGSCSGEGSCTAKATQSQTCNGTGTRTRTCSSSCAWGSWGACSATDAGGGGASDGATSSETSMLLEPGPAIPGGEAGPGTASPESHHFQGSCQAAPGDPGSLLVALGPLVALILRRAGRGIRARAGARSRRRCLRS